MVINVRNDEAPSIQFAQLDFCGYLVALIVPSEALILRWAYAGDPLTLGAFEGERGLISARCANGAPHLILRLSRRKISRLGACCTARVIAASRWRRSFAASAQSAYGGAVYPPCSAEKATL